MTMRNILRGAALASTCLLPPAAFAQSVAANSGSDQQSAKTSDLNAEIDLGGQYQSGSSAMYGRRNGDWNDGFRALGAFSVKGGNTWDSGGTYGYTAFGKNLDFSSGNLAPESSLGFKVGNQGKWGLSFNYDAITYFQSDSFHSAFLSGGNGQLNPGVTPGAYNSWQANLVPLTTSDVSTRRDRFTVNGKYNLGYGLEFSTELFHEHKEGTMEQSMSIGSTTSSFYPPNATNSPPHSPLAGAPAASTAAGALGALVYFPQPIDYDTDRYDIKLAYKSDKLLSELVYSFMKFSNGNNSFNGQDPFSLAGPGATAAQKGPGGIYALPGQAAFALPPNNYQHTVTGDIGYSLTPTTQLSGTFQYGLQIANNTLPPDELALNPNLTPTAAQAALIANPVGGTSDQWNATAQIINGNLTLTSRPLTHFDVKAAYTINSYQNQTARTAMYNAGNVLENTAIPSTTAAQLAAVSCAGASVDTCTIPWAWTKQKVSLDVGYEFWPGTRGILGYAFQNVDRDYMMNDHSIENSFSARVNSRFSNVLFGSLSAEYSSRDAKPQNLGTPNAALEVSSVYLGNGGAAWFDSSRNTSAVKGNLMYAATNDLNFGLNGQYVVDHYPKIYVEGMDWDSRFSIGPEVSYRPIPSVSTSLFYNFELMQYHSHSVYGTICTTGAGVTSVTTPTTAIPNPTCPAGSTGQSMANWNQTNNDWTHSVGADVEWQAIPDVLKIIASYNFAYGNISWDYADNLGAATLGAMNAYNMEAWTAQPIPNVTSILHSLKIQGVYNFTPRMSLWLGYTFERLTNSDYNNAIQQASYASNLMSGDANPDYTVHVVSASLHIKF